MTFRPDSRLVQEVVPSPSHGERLGTRPDMLLLHYTGMPTAQGALERLADPHTGVSCHYFVFEDGRVVQMVPEAARAWHAGQSFWAGERDINSRSIGIEIAHPGHAGGLPPFPEAQIAATLALSRDIVDRRRIPALRVLAHSDVAPERKEDPGESFPWDRFYREGVGHYVTPALIRDGGFYALGDTGKPVGALQAQFAAYGYDQPVTGAFDVHTQFVVTAFQRHFRQERVDGIADASTIATLNDLLAARPRLRRDKPRG